MSEFSLVRGFLEGIRENVLHIIRASALFVAEENILTPDSLLHMLELHNKVLAIKADNKTWTDLCYRIPIADIFLTKRRKKRQIAIGEKLD